MLSPYFKMKISDDNFKNNLSKIFTNLENKKVLIYGAEEEFELLNKEYNFNKKFNIVGILNKKFEENNNDNFLGIKTVKPSDISNVDYDVILITNVLSSNIFQYLVVELQVDEQKIEKLFDMISPSEIDAYNYLCKFNFEKHLKKIKKKLENKSVVIYGAGIFFEVMNKYFNLNDINIIGIADKKYVGHDENDEFLGYKIYSPDEIRALNPDYVLVATKFFVEIIEKLYYELLKGTKIKIKPLIKKPFLKLFKEIWG